MTTGYPIQLQLQGRLCVVVGGGRVGLRKVAGLLGAGARVRLITGNDTPELSAAERLEILRRPYREGDLEGGFLAFAATDNRSCNAMVTAEARRRQIPVNIADDPQRSDFFLPARLARGELLITVSTGGRSPALAARLRNYLAEIIGPEWETVLAVAAAIRRKQLTPEQKTEYGDKVLDRLIAAELPALIAQNDAEKIDQLFGEVLGEKISLADLGIHLPKGTP